MLRIKTDPEEFSIEGQSDFSFEKLIEITSDIEKGEFTKLPNEFFYTIYDSEKNIDVLEAIYRSNRGYSNIYNHAKYILSDIQLSDQEKELRKSQKYYIKKMDYQFNNMIKVKDNHKKKDDKNKTNNNFERIIKFLKTKKGIGFIIFTLFCIGMFIFILKFLGEDNNTKADSVTKEEIYQQALLGHKEMAIKNFNKISHDNMTNKDKLILANLLIENGELKKASNIKGSKFVENVLYEKKDYKNLKNFNSSNRTNNGVFDLAIKDKNYDKAITLVNDITKSEQRKKDLAIAYINLDKLNEAKKLAANSSDTKINELILNKQKDKLKESKEQKKKLEKDYKAVKNKKGEKDKAKNLKTELNEIDEDIKKLSDEVS